ncbi:MAG: hypothetical protein JXB10_18305 [Pirellulales bacterium]|nr:hypothetical protein [Pirellulales bacterium]
MKTIDVSATTPSLSELLALAHSGNLLLRAPDGKEFLLAKVDDLALEVEMIRQQPELMEFLSQRSREESRSSLRQVREKLGLTGQSG